MSAVPLGSSESAAPLKRVAVILAGGTGTRVGLALPKQLITVAGKPIIEHTIATFQASPVVDEIIVMMAPGHLDAVRSIVRSGSYGKVSAIHEGAGTRSDTTRAALDAVAGTLPDGEDCHVLLHDAVRPLVSHSIIEANVEALRTYDAVDTAIPSADTVIRVAGEAPVIAEVPPRADLRRGQTPQSFRLSVLRRAYEIAASDPEFTATDDCTVVLRYLPDVPIAVVNGAERNLKVTEPIDIHIADKLFQLASTDTSPIDDAGLRAALEGRTMAVFGASYGIGEAIAAQAEGFGAHVHRFSRSGSGTHVESRAEVAAARDVALETTGRIDFVVNAAGVLPRGELHELSEEAVFHATEVNYLAPVWIAQAFGEALLASRGSMLLFTSSSYTRGRAGYALYSSAKAGVVNLTQAVAAEWAERGARINCVNPERTATPMRSAAFGEEPPESLLEADVVARRSLEVMVSDLTGQVVDVRRNQLVP
ncbi:bifunctional cytidylyltransferase/SDR family oxidoreductase [Nocardioides sp. R-C-SC26]|uniref:bifunctional cytidylyltransferase/SDR family oxidoreductase n=1 Tax=Nocardioides sp. R-C-SC26 TaxID=2870414 RepID=UPI001E5FBA87|nr:bifunctional cytidylyltransferase/SDR family oxidoreductase [Nocardioides sp. R-C-SC26]